MVKNYVMRYIPAILLMKILFILAQLESVSCVPNTYSDYIFGNSIKNEYG